MSNFKKDLKLLFESFESKEMLLILKENFIFMLKENLVFEEEYKEDYKELYFEKFKNYIDELTKCMNNQKVISELELTQLYRMIYYQDKQNILYTLAWSIEYIRNNYVEINLPKEIIIKQEIEEDIASDLYKIDSFLKEYICY